MGQMLKVDAEYFERVQQKLEEFAGANNSNWHSYSGFIKTIDEHFASDIYMWALKAVDKDLELEQANRELQLLAHEEAAE